MSRIDPPVDPSSYSTAFIPVIRPPPSSSLRKGENVEKRGGRRRDGREEKNGEREEEEEGDRGFIPCFVIRIDVEEVQWKKRNVLYFPNSNSFVTWERREV